MTVWLRYKSILPLKYIPRRNIAITLSYSSQLHPSILSNCMRESYLIIFEFMCRIEYCTCERARKATSVETARRSHGFRGFVTCHAGALKACH